MRQISTPLPEEIHLDQLALFFTTLSEYEGIAYRGTDGLIDGGFAFRTSAVLFYGQRVEGIVKMLGVKVIENVPAEDRDLAHSLQRFMATYNLYLLDWCQPQLITANVDMIGKFLEG